MSLVMQQSPVTRISFAHGELTSHLRRVEMQRKSRRDSLSDDVGGCRPRLQGGLLRVLLRFTPCTTAEETTRTVP